MDARRLASWDRVSAVYIPVDAPLHIIHPDLIGMRPRLRRMVVHKGEKHRTVVQQIANMGDDYRRKGASLVDAVFEYVGLTSREREALYEATYRAIVDRQTAEGSVGDGAILLSVPGRMRQT